MAQAPAFRKLFSALIKEDRVSHAYLFFGPGVEGGEAFALAESLASYIETGSWDAHSLLDVMMLSGRTAGIDDVREAIHFLYEFPLRARKKTLIVSNADSLTIPASQALLKISEEPPAHALILMISKDVAGVLPALLSRTQRIYIAGGEVSRSEDADEKARALLAARSAKERSDLLKLFFEDDVDFSLIMRSLIHVLKGDVEKNANLIQALLNRWSAMERFNTNRRLQIEAAFAEAGK